MAKLERDEKKDYFIKMPKSVINAMDWSEGDQLKLVFKSDSLQIVKKE